MLKSPLRPTLVGHLKIARLDHWVKNVFILPGIVVGMAFEPWSMPSLAIRMVLGCVSACLIASSNYTINEVLDAPFDRFHPTKHRRSVPAAEVSIPWAYVQWLATMILGLAIGMWISIPFTITMFVLWIMGCIYNIPPIRSKDKPYIDVLSEAINNPLRLLAGWYIVGTLAFPSGSLVMSYWMIGCYFMAIKRFAELRAIGSAETAAAYRRSFAYYTPDRLLVSIMFYGSSAMLFLGAFCMRYRLELVLAYPLIAVVMAVYLMIGLKPNSPAQAPERLYRERWLMLSVICCSIVIGVLLFVNVPLARQIVAPTMPMAGLR